MATEKERILVVCPGRGSYQHTELGYLRRYHAGRSECLEQLDDIRRDSGQASLSELDSADRFDPVLHARGDNASALIYACCYADFLALDGDRYQVVAVTGNSLGWYSALACAGALSARSGMQVVNRMGGVMHTQAPGGQLLYPQVDDNWQQDPEAISLLARLVRQINAGDGTELYDSILLGGMRVFAGNNTALAQLQGSLPRKAHYPIRLAGHAAFHSPLMQGVVDIARESLAPGLFENPALPLVDGRGQAWFPCSSEPHYLWDYTFGQQLLQTYDYTRAIQNAVREFAPQRIVLTGPGNSLGSATAQSLIEIGWHGLASKQDFIEQQRSDPFILSMGLEEQRKLVCGQ